MPGAPWATSAGTDAYGAWAVFTVGDVAHRLRWIPPGRFLMGAPRGEWGRQSHERPPRQVAVAGFWFGETPVTQALWSALVDWNPSRFVSPDRPVDNVTHDDCRDFIDLVNARVPGLVARLPREAEWEYACRAGTTGATWAGEPVLDDAVLDGIAWYAGNSAVDFELPDGDLTADWPEDQPVLRLAGSHPVARKAANPFGLHDMLGNVHEWCADANEADNIYRGGSWTSYASEVRAAFRVGMLHNAASDDRGFRLAA